MFKKIKEIFSKKQIVEQEKEITPDALPQPPKPEPLPDTIEVPWKECAAVKNYEDTITKTHNDLKDFLYNVKIKEITAIKAIERLENASDAKIEEIKEKYLKDKIKSYEFTVPAATGRPGFLKKKKTK
tara:strand:- start:95 stop:478 length:384 start_codon:yes stop_codon:yes gene_type:complete